MAHINSVARALGSCPPNIELLGSRRGVVRVRGYSLSAAGVLSRSATQPFPPPPQCFDLAAVCLRHGRPLILCNKTWQ